jgi:FG-GAP-like repeat
MRGLLLWVGLPVMVASAATEAQDGAARFRMQQIASDFGIGYAVRVADINGDRRPDMIAINATELVWFENPGWQKHVMLDGATPKDNVTIAAHDIDGDGTLDVALGAAWNPRDTTGGGTLHWASRTAPDGRGPWRVHSIGEEPTLHRIRWADVDGDGRSELIVTPLHGRGTAPPTWDGPGARVLVFRVPDDPARPWQSEIADSSLHILHNFLVADLGGTRADELVTASREGVSVLSRSGDGAWRRRLIGEGAPGEVVLGRVQGQPMLATIEPWHGTSVVVYAGAPEAVAAGVSNAPSATLWPRQVIESGIKGGHAVAWADVDGDGDDELVVGWREAPVGVALYEVDRQGRLVSKSFVDEGGMAAEDLVTADLDADGRPEIVASGRATANVRIYWNATQAGRKR